MDNQADTPLPKIWRLIWIGTLAIFIGMIISNVLRIWLDRFWSMALMLPPLLVILIPLGMAACKEYREYRGSGS